jgi:predicted metallo-beta-lactamase superfamily hydrolase
MENIRFVAAESLGVRGLCCAVTVGSRRIVIDPGLALGFYRHGHHPHPVQVAVGRLVRRSVVNLLHDATDVVFSHFHGDHVPLKQANPFQLSFAMLPERFRDLRIWSKSGDESHPEMRRRFQDLQELAQGNLQVVEGRTEGPLSFSLPVPHGEPGTHLGTVMMTRIELEDGVFVHASDIQLLNTEAVDQIVRWRPDVVLTAGPPLYLSSLETRSREGARRNALRLADQVDTLIVDHHLLRSEAGAQWLTELRRSTGGKICSAADFMRSPPLLLEARRRELYDAVPVPDGWMDDYEQGRAEAEPFLRTAVERGVIPSLSA